MKKPGSAAGPSLELVRAEPAHPLASFSAADYLQLAAHTRRSVRIEVEGLGFLDIVDGNLMAARDADGPGLSAAIRILAGGGLDGNRTARCYALPHPPTGSALGDVNAILLEAARQMDESTVGPTPLSDEEFEWEGWTTPVANITEPTADEVEMHREAGLQAMLDRDFPAAYAAFLRIVELGKDDANVQANLRRLRHLLDKTEPGT